MTLRRPDRGQPGSPPPPPTGARSAAACTHARRLGAVNWVLRLGIGWARLGGRRPHGGRDSTIAIPGFVPTGPR